MGSASSKSSSGTSADGKLELSINDAVEHLRKIPHIQPNSVATPYSAGHLSLDLTCKVNATVPCRVTFFLLAAEHEDGTMHSESQRVLSLYCQDASRQDFPGPGNPTFPLALTDIQTHAKHFMNCNEGVYPIVIRVESLAPRWAGYRLDQLPSAESAQMQGYMSRLNVNTVFARLQLRRQQWQVDVLHQHLWLQGVCYQLPKCDTLANFNLHQEPLPPRPPSRIVPNPPAYNTPTPYPAIAPRPPLCQICTQRPVQVSNFPCNHACMCVACAREQLQKFPFCPQCSTPLQRCNPLRLQAAQTA